MADPPDKGTAQRAQPCPKEDIPTRTLRSHRANTPVIPTQDKDESSK